MPNIKIIKTYHDLNERGCKFFLDLNESSITRVTSAQLRWLSARIEGQYISDAQKEACDYIDSITKTYGTKEWAKINLKILLYVNPCKAQDKYIIELLKCGVDIRYVREDNCKKIVLQKNMLYISFSPTLDKLVNTGIIYTGIKHDDPLIEYYKTEFDNKFNKARKVILNENGVISLKDKNIVYWYNIVKNYDAQQWISLIIGACLGGIVGLLFGLLTAII